MNGRGPTTILDRAKAIIVNEKKDYVPDILDAVIEDIYASDMH